MKNTTVWLLCESVLVAVDGFIDRKKVLALKMKTRRFDWKTDKEVNLKNI